MVHSALYSTVLCLIRVAQHARCGSKPHIQQKRNPQMWLHSRFMLGFHRMRLKTIITNRITNRVLPCSSREASGSCSHRCSQGMVFSWFYFSLHRQLVLRDKISPSQFIYKEFPHAIAHAQIVVVY